MILYLLIFLQKAIAIGPLVEKLLNDGWRFHMVGNDTWYEANVPSTFHLDLLDNGLIDDPYFGMNLLDMYQFEMKDWEYSMNFNVSQDLIQKKVQQLVFYGLDTHADVILNGMNILKANNMHRTWEVDVTGKLKIQNTLTIYFYSAVVHDMQAEQQTGFNLPYNYSYSRKAAYQYGWDWGPRLVTAGIWKDVKLLAFDGVKINYFHVRTVQIDSYGADVEFITEFQIGKSLPYSMTIYEIGNKQIKSSFNTTILLLNQAKTQIIKTQQHFQNISYWWPAGIGPQNLHTFRLEFADMNGLILHTHDITTGIRKIEWIQNKDDDSSETFYAKINGRPIYLKGGNYIPPDMFMPRAKKNLDVYKNTIQDALKAGFNTLRLWGGGQFEYDEFYSLCDQAGLLVWHDLMFACAFYPGDKDFLNNVAAEISDNVKRIRTHPSIAMWNGNNEVEIGWKEWGWQNDRTPAQITEMQSWYDNLFHVTIANVLSEIDPDTFYWPTSPSSSFHTTKAGFSKGDIHYWGVWAEQSDIEDYTYYIGRFNSEYGMQASPDPSNIQRFTNDFDDENVDSPVIQLHERHIQGWPNLKHYFSKYFQEPKDFLNTLYISQVLQYISLETAISSLRASKPYNMGSLYWQINDVWPVFSWASVDYYGCWKGGHYAAKKYHQDPIITVQQIDTSDYFIVKVIHEIPQLLQGTVEIQWINNDGSYIQLWQLFVEKISDIQAEQIMKIYLEDFNLYKTSSFLAINFNGKFDNGTQVVFQTTHHFVRPLEQILFQPDYTIDVIQGGLLFLSKNLVRNLYIGLQNNCLKVSDNYFDLVPGVQKIVYTEYSSTDLNAELIYFISIWDSYN